MKLSENWLLLFVGLITTEAMASIPIGDFEYTVLSESRREIRINGPRKGTELTGDIVIPATVTRPLDGRKYTVVEIGLAGGNIREEYVWSPAFSNQSGITSVTIPSTVTDIWADTFSGCPSIKTFFVDDGNPCYASVDGVLYSRVDGKVAELLRYPPAATATSFSVPQGITVGYGAFRDNEKLKTLILEKGARLSEGCMVGNLGIRTFRITDTDYYNIRNGMILSDDGTTLFCVPPALNAGRFTVPASVSTIGRYACASIRASSIDFANVTRIKDQAFLTAGIKELTIPSTVSEIGYAAFEECRLLETAVIQSRIKILPVAMFRNCDRLTSVQLPTSCTGLGGKAFFGCSSLDIFSLANFTTLEQPNVTSDYHFAFSGITKMNWPSRVRAVPEKCFFNCRDMKEFRLNENTEVIKEYAFYNTSIETFNSGALNEIHQYAFEGDTSLRKIVLADSDHPLKLAHDCFPANPGAEIFINHSGLQSADADQGYDWTDAFYGNVIDAIFYTSFLSQPVFFSNWDTLYVPAGAVAQYEKFAHRKGRVYEMFSVRSDGSSVTVTPNYDWVKITQTDRKDTGLEIHYTARGVKMHTLYPSDFVFDTPSLAVAPEADALRISPDGRSIMLAGAGAVFRITDMNGRQIASGELENQRIISIEIPGIYMIVIDGANSSIVRKVMIR